MRFLIDECLTVDLVAVAGQAGHEAHHVARVGKSGWKDWNVARYARDGDLILVANNASDFRRLYAAQPLHAGLIILIPAVDRILQQRLFKTALDELAVLGEPVNRVRSSRRPALTPVGSSGRRLDPTRRSADNLKPLHLLPW